jgi:hypothetical protein
MSSADEELRAAATTVIDQAVAEALSLCHGITREYLAYIQGVPVTTLFPEGAPRVNEVGFLDKNKKQWFMKLAIVDDMYYKFPLEKFPSKIVKDNMEKIARNLAIAVKMVLETEVAPVMGDASKVPHPELFHDSRLAMTPFTSFFLYNEAHGRTLHDRYTKRIAFVWTAEGIDQEEPMPVNIAVPNPHPDDFLGPEGAKNMPEGEVSGLIAQINIAAGRGPDACRACGGAVTCGCLADE